jgi:hypothetical protein
MHLYGNASPACLLSNAAQRQNQGALKMTSEFKLRPLHIHVSASLPVEELHRNDRGHVGVYKVEVESSVPDGFAAWAALEAFHDKIGFSLPENFEIDVFDPESREYLVQEEPSSSEGIFYQYCDKLSDDRPNVTLRLTLDVTYSPGGVNTRVLKRMLEGTVAYGISNGGLTGSTPAQVDIQNLSVAEITAALI